MRRMEPMSESKSITLKEESSFTEKPWACGVGDSQSLLKPSNVLVSLAFILSFLSEIWCICFIFS